VWRRQLLISEVLKTSLGIRSERRQVCPKSTDERPIQSGLVCVIASSPRAAATRLKRAPARPGARQMERTISELLPTHPRLVLPASRQNLGSPRLAQVNRLPVARRNRNRASSSEGDRGQSTILTVPKHEFKVSRGTSGSIESRRLPLWRWPGGGIDREAHFRDEAAMLLFYPTLGEALVRNRLEGGTHGR